MSTTATRVYTAADVAAAWLDGSAAGREVGYESGRVAGERAVLEAIEAEMGPVGRIVYWLQGRWQFLR